MAFPTSQIDTTNLDSATDDPSLARADLFDAVTSLNSIIADANGNNGVVVANASGKITATKLPNTITATGTQTFKHTCTQTQTHKPKTHIFVVTSGCVDERSLT